MRIGLSLSGFMDTPAASLLALLISLPATLILAALSYYLIEKPLMNWGKRTLEGSIADFCRVGQTLFVTLSETLHALRRLPSIPRETLKVAIGVEHATIREQLAVKCLPQVMSTGFCMMSCSIER